MKVLAIGRTEILYDAILTMLAGHTIVGIVTSPASPEYEKNENDFEALAKKINCPFISTRKLNSAVFELAQSSGADIAISINWNHVIGDSLINLIPHGILNAHFGDLPRYRGNAVINWAILNNEPEITFTIHQMAADELDSGDIILQKKMPLTPQSTITDVVKFARQHVPNMFLDAVNGLRDHTLIPRCQSVTGMHPFRCFPRLPMDSRINWTSSAAFIDRLIRASTKPYTGAFTYIRINNRIHKLTIWNSRVVKQHTEDIGMPGHVVNNDRTTGETWVYTGQGILGISLAQLDNEPEFEPGKKFNSIRLHLDIDLGEELLRLQNFIVN